MLALKTLESKNEYNIGWIAALAIERAAATALLDERHDQPRDFVQFESDRNSYTWGRISNHNVVIASLPAGGYGLTNATKIAIGLISSCPHINIGLLVGIGAGVPESGLDIRLGDVAVSRPHGSSGGVVQYDTGKSKDGAWERTGILVPPREILLNALGNLQAEHELDDSQILSLLEEAGKSSAKFARAYRHPGAEHDHLYYSTSGGNSKEQEVLREARLDITPIIHYGTIGSGNILIKDAALRKSISDSLGPDCICLEMEAAGVMNSFPCLVVRGICDYADAHKNDLWQRYASATAAAFAKELLRYVPESDVARSRETDKALGALQSSVDELKDKLVRVELDARSDRINRLLRLLDRHPHEERKDRNPQRVTGTCEWFTNHTLFRQWLNGAASRTLWVTADPGCGKSVLARYLIDEVLPEEDRSICYFFFKDDFDDQKMASDAGCAMLYQVFSSNRNLITDEVLTACEAYGEKLTERFLDLWKILERLASSLPGELVCVIDALDECRSDDRSRLLQSISKHSHSRKSKIKAMILSRPYFSVGRDFEQAHVNGTVIRLSGENEKEREEISKEIDIVLGQRINDLCNRRNLSLEDKLFLLQAFTSMPQRTYLWAHLTMAIVEDSPGFTRGEARRIVEHIPPSVDAAYERILQKSVNPSKTRLILQILLVGNRAFTVKEMDVLLALNGQQRRYGELEEFLEPEARFQTTIRDICGLFVVVVDSRVYLLHQTAREFLLSQMSAATQLTPRPTLDRLDNNRKAIEDDSNESQMIRTSASPFGTGVSSGKSLLWKHAFTPSECHHTLTERCLWLINLTSIRRYLSGLFRYAVLNWIEHLENSEADPEDDIFSHAAVILDPDATMLPAWFAVLRNSQPLQGVAVHLNAFDKVSMLQSLRNAAGGAFLLALASILGSKILLNGLLTLFPNRWNSKDLSKALWWSVCHGMTKTTSILLKRGADANTMATGQSFYEEPALREPVSERFCWNSSDLQRFELESSKSELPSRDVLVSMIKAKRIFPQFQAQYERSEFRNLSRHVIASLKLCARPLEMAVHCQGEEMTVLLQSYGADPDVDGGVSPDLLAAIKWRNSLIMAHQYGSTMIKFWKKQIRYERINGPYERQTVNCHDTLDILWSGVSNASQDDVNLALHFALEEACLDCITKCLEHGAETHIQIRGMNAIEKVLDQLEIRHLIDRKLILGRPEGTTVLQAVRKQLEAVPEDSRFLSWSESRNQFIEALIYQLIVEKLEEASHASKQRLKLRLRTGPKSRTQSPPPMDDDELIALLTSGSKRAMKRAGRQERHPSDTDYRRRSGKSH